MGQLNSTDTFLRTFSRSLKLLDSRDRKRILYISIFQTSLGLIDLIAITLVGVLGALTVNGIQSRAPGNRVSNALKILQVESFSFHVQVAIIGILATLALIGRTLLSAYFARKVIFFLSLRSARISGNLVRRLLSQSILVINSKSVQQNMYLITSGVHSVTLGIISTAISLLVDGFLLLVLGIGLIIVDPLIALSTISIFGATGAFLYLLQNKHARKLGNKYTILDVQSNQSIFEVLTSFRELVVKNRINFYSDRIEQTRLSMASTLAELNFMPQISKYVFELTLVVGGLLVSAIQFLTNDATGAISSLSVFMVTGSRIAPALIRIQQGLILVKSSLGAALPTLDYIENMTTEPRDFEKVANFSKKHFGFNSIVELDNINFSYPNNDVPTLRNINLKIEENEFVAIVGSSGAGKTTLVDILLGVLQPDSGTVRISNLEPKAAINNWPGAISYLPQDIMIANGTILENIALGYPISQLDEESLQHSIAISHLSDLISELPLGVETQVGDRGTKLSGGQRQRLGIARSVYTWPKLLILDEATSALDGETEAAVSASIQEAKGRMTIVMIAHRLSTIRDADKIVYMEKGKILGIDTFENLRKNFLNFDKQANLMGL